MVRETPSELFGDVDRTVLAAGTADGHGQVVACVLHVQGQPFADEGGDVVDHGFDAAELGQPGGDRSVAPRQRAQLRVVVGIGQAAHVEDQIGIVRNAALVGERLEGQNDRGAVRLDQVTDPGAQLPGRQVRRVDDVFLVAQGGQQFPFAGDAVLQRGFQAFVLQAVGQRMAAPGFGIALHQGMVVGFQEDHVQRRAHGAQAGQDAGQVVQIARRAHIDGDRHPFQAAVLGAGDEFVQETHRQVVDAGIAGVLQHAQGHGLARAGDSGDEDDVQHGVRNEGGRVVMIGPPGSSP